MKNKIKISGRPGLMWLFGLALILVTGIFLVKEARAFMDSAIAVLATGGEYIPPNNSFTDLLR